MPTRPYNTKCSMLGCPNPKSRMNSFCMDHGGRERYEYTYDADKLTAERKEFNAEYSSRFWKNTRALTLSKQPLCQACLTRGIVAVATEVDHVFPWAKIGKGAFTRNIFQGLCKPCHHHKTVREQRGYIEHYYNNQTKTYDLSQYGAMMEKFGIFG